MRELSGHGIVSISKSRRRGRAGDLLRFASQTMPATIGAGTLATAEVVHLLGGSKLRSFSRINTDRDHFKVATCVERDHPQRASQAVQNLCAELRTTVVNEGENNGALPAILAQRDRSAVFVVELGVEWQWRAQ